MATRDFLGVDMSLDHSKNWLPCYNSHCACVPPIQHALHMHAVESCAWLGLCGAWLRHLVSSLSAASTELQLRWELRRHRDDEFVATPLATTLICEMSVWMQPEEKEES
jgi:hypothetical protein